ncbi:MAG: sulfite exporter TauE/SafE family protein [Candidatus Falkowbacteria bacterium]
MLKQIELNLNGLHCRSCKTLIETEVAAMPGVKNIEVDYRTGLCRVEFDDGKTSRTDIEKTITGLNYTIAGDKSADETRNKKIIHGLLFPLALAAAVIIYLIFRASGGLEILSRLNEESVSYPLILLIGFLASFHCVGMCGGLVTAYTAGMAAKNPDKKTGFSRSHLQYNLGRLVSYAIIGGVLGGVGSFFGVNPVFSGAVMLLAGLFMILMALSLFTKFRWLKKVNFRLPSFIARWLYGQKHADNPKSPLIIGLMTGFMPCGPLQAMQLYALGTGDIARGALSMGLYALGTIPLMFGFGAFVSSLSARYVGRVMKISAVVVAVLGLVMLNRGLTNFGYGFRGLLPSNAESAAEQNPRDVADYQTINMDLTYSGYSPNVLYIKPGLPVRWVINVKQMTGCTDAIMIESLAIKKDLVYGENIIEFTPPTGVKEIKFSCWMRMVWGKFIVTDEGIGSDQNIQPAKAQTPPTGTCSLEGCSE